jgi:hypothetical protein
MTGHELGERLGDKLGEHFVTRQERADGILFRGPDPEHRGRVLRLLITFEAWEDYEAEMPEAVGEAIDYLKEDCADVVIREDQAGKLVVVRESRLHA